MTPDPGGDAGGNGSFEDRLRAARARRAMDEPKASPASHNREPSAMAIGLRVGVELVSAFAVAVAIGWALDRWLHTTPLLLVLFLLMGGAAGILNVWRLMGRTDTRSGPKR